MAFGNAYTFEELARASRRGQSGPLAPPSLDPAHPVPPAVGREIVQILVSDVKRRFMTGTTPQGAKWRPLKYNRPSGPGQPLRDTGRLMASITGRATPTGVVVGTNHVGAALQNFGGTVRPKKGKFLSIPLTLQAKRVGSPRRMKGTGAVPLFAKKVAGRMVGHFLLVKKVTVPARPFLGVSKEAEKAVADVLAGAAVRRWQQQTPGM